MMTAARAETTMNDPLRPPSASAAKPPPARNIPPAPRYRLCAIMMSGDQRKAMINGKVRRVGDRFSGAELLAIEPDHVKLRIGSTVQVIRLVPMSVKVPAGE